jgi:diguanylate cyclase (GGDEF)-like protein
VGSSGIRTGLIGALVLLQIVTLAVFFGASWFQQERARTEHMDRLLQRVSSESALHANDFLQRASRVPEQTAALMTAGVLTADGEADMVAYMADQLSANEALAGIYVADRSGNLTHVSRSPRGPGFVRVTTITGRPTPEILLRDVSPDGETVWRGRGDDRPEPAERPWFQLAAAGAGTVWTPAHRLAGSGELAVTTARAVPGTTGTVVGADLELAPLSQFIAGLNVSRSGRALIVDADAHVIADPALAVRADPGRPVADDLVLRAFGALGGSGSTGETVVLAEGDDTFRAAGRTLTGPDWRVIVVASEADFVGSLRTAERQGIVWAGALALLGLLLVVLVLSGALRRPLRLLERRSSYDDLTGLLNRRAVEETARRLLADPTGTLGVALIDIDHLSSVSDRYGRTVGDRALVHVARAVESGLRESDVLGRWGDRQFLAVINTASQQVLLDVLSRVADRVRSRTLEVQGGPITLTISVGAAVYPAHGRTVAELVENADRAMQMVKYTGHDDVRVFGASTHDTRMADAGPLDLPAGAP